MVVRSSFLRNRADAAGGTINHAAAILVGSISGSLFEGNTATDGGGVSVSGMFSVAGNTFVRNVAAARGGGAMLNGDTTLRGNRFLGNVADEGGGIWADWYGQTIEANVFAGNAARRGGAAAITYSDFLGLSANTVTGNSASAEAGGLVITPEGAGMLRTDRYASNIIWGNAAPGAGADLLLDDFFVGSTSRTILLARNLVGSFVSRCADADPSAGCIPKLTTEGAVNGPPGFVQQGGDDPAAWDLRLAAGSPCIDTGLVPPYGWSKDIDGIERPLDGDGDGVALPDVGAAGVDASNYDFRIQVVDLSMPYDTCHAGEVCTVRWKTNGTARPVAKVRLQYRFLDEPITRDIALVPGNPGVWDWMAPPPAQCAGSFAIISATLLDGAGVSLGTDSQEIQLQR